MPRTIKINPEPYTVNFETLMGMFLSAAILCDGHKGRTKKWVLKTLELIERSPESQEEWHEAVESIDWDFFKSHKENLWSA